MITLEADMAKDNQEEKMVNVQVTERVREMLGLLKKRYNTSRMSEALEKFLEENDPELVEVAEMVLRVQRRATEDDE